MDDENKLITERKKKLEAIRKNFAAYPNSFRKKGYGDKIIQNLINKSKKLNIKKISLETGTDDFLHLQENYLTNVVLKSADLFPIIKMISMLVIWIY